MQFTVHHHVAATVDDIPCLGRETGDKINQLGHLTRSDIQVDTVQVQGMVAARCGQSHAATGIEGKGAVIGVNTQDGHLNTVAVTYHGGSDAHGIIKTLELRCESREVRWRDGTARCAHLQGHLRQLVAHVLEGSVFQMHIIQADVAIGQLYPDVLDVECIIGEVDIGR